MKTPITEYLEQQHIHYRLLPHQSPSTTIEDTATQRGIPLEIMVKSILLRDMGNHYALACVPGNQSVDPKKVRNILKLRRMTCVNYADILTITGYEPGTVSPLLLKTDMPVIFDHQLKQIDKLTISSGNNMAGIILSQSDLVQLCQPIIANICRT